MSNRYDHCSRSCNDKCNEPVPAGNCVVPATDNCHEEVSCRPDAGCSGGIGHHKGGCGADRHHCRPCPEENHRKACVDVDDCSVSGGVDTEREVCARLRIPPYRCVSRICVELLDTCSHRGGLILLYKVTVYFVDLCGEEREYTVNLRYAFWDICCEEDAHICLIGDPEYELSGYCLRLCFPVRIVC